MTRARPQFYCSKQGCAARWENVSRSRTGRCRQCGGSLTEVRKVEQGHGQFIPDVPSHFNDAFGCEVRGRTHLRQLQKKHGTVDFEFVQRQPSNAAAQFRRDMKRKGVPIW